MIQLGWLGVTVGTRLEGSELLVHTALQHSLRFVPFFPFHSLPQHLRIESDSFPGFSAAGRILSGSQAVLSNIRSGAHYVQ